MTTNRLPPAKTLLFFSGITALVYQTLWVKQLTLVVGIDVHAVTIGVSGFFAGLALGGALAGRWADRVASPLRLYALLEAGIALLAVVTTFGLAAAPPLFVELQDRLGAPAWLLPLGLVMLPAVLMGGTLPALLAAVRPPPSGIGRDTGRLYAANTAGAILGALITLFVLVPVFGVKGAAVTAASMNLLLALVAWRGARRTAPAARAGTPAAAALSMDVRWALALYALAGAVAMGYEVVWTQSIVQFLSTRAFAFAMVLATYLLGLVLGSALYARFADRVARRWTVFALLIAGAGLMALLTFALLGPWLPAAQQAVGETIYLATGSQTLMNAGRFALAAAVVVLPPTLLLGAAFPAAARLAVEAGHAGRDIGLVLALNTALGIAGVLFTGFVLIPALGLAGSLGALALAAALIGAAAMLRGAGMTRVALAGATALVVVAVASAVLLPGDRLATQLAEARGGELLYYDEAPGGTVAVLEQTASQGRFRRLYIQGVSNSGDAMPSLRYMRLQALLPLLIQSGEPKSALVIAFGTGITAGSLLLDDGLERRLCVELLPPVIEAAPLFRGNQGAGSDPRLEIVIADGRHELMRRDERFDLITLEPPPPAAAGVVNLYSRDFYRLAARRLTADGMLAQWWPIGTQNAADSRSLVRAMLDVFPHVTLWTTEVHEMLLLGSMQPLDLDYARIAERLARPAIRQALHEVGIDTPAELLATWITDRGGLEAYVGDAPAVTDDRPRIEYAAWVRPDEITRVLPALLGLRTAPPVHALDSERRRIETAYRRLADFYGITLAALRRDRVAWTHNVRNFARGRQANAYYDWFLGR